MVTVDRPSRIIPTGAVHFLRTTYHQIWPPITYVDVTQVHVRHRPCFGIANAVTCNCAVAFRENNNVLGLFACLHGWPPIPVRYLSDPLSPGGSITVSSDGSEYKVSHVQHVSVLLRDTTSFIFAL